MGENAFVKNREIARRLNDQTMRQVTNLSIAAIVASVVFISYFIAQYLLFSQDEMGIRENSS